MLEPCDANVSSTVPRGLDDRKVVRLLGIAGSWGSDTGLSCSTEMTRFDSLGAPYTPAVLCAHDDGTSSRRTHCKKSAEHLPLSEPYDACKSLHMLTMLSMRPSPTSASMLADAPLPRGSDATLASGVHCPRVPEQFVT
jgi:hypothetical protein